ncbi:MAG: hypothetical protein ACYC35_06430 [Pirellulales bacterium]
MENSRPVNQLATIRAQILNRRAIFARQGFVVATWRMRGGARFGPYYQLAYREAGRQRAIYLGRSDALAEQVRVLLAELQQPLRDDRLLDRLAAEARASLRRANAELNRVLGTFGFYLKGRHEFRRLRGAGAVASPARQMVDAWILHSRSAFRVEKSQLAEQLGVRREARGLRREEREDSSHWTDIPAVANPPASLCFTVFLTDSPESR